MNLSRPEPLTFERADGTVIVGQPATRGQMRSVFALDSDIPDAAERRGRAVAILLQGACTSEILDSLTAEEEQDIIYGFSAQNRGIVPPADPSDLCAALSAEAASIPRQTIEEIIVDHDATTLEIAVLMRRPPAEIEAMGYVDSQRWLAACYENQSAARTFLAAVHGMQLR